MPQTTQSTLAKKMNRLLPFVAIGTVADCQSILEPTNRLLVKAGLNILNQGQTPYPGLNELTKQTALGDKQIQGYQIGSRDLAFTYSPILNSSGRMSHAKLSIDTLAASKTNAPKLAQELVATNHQRKQDVKNITKDLEADAHSQVNSGSKLIWIQGDFSKGLTGLLASKLENQFQLPVAVVSKSGDVFTGSMRAGLGYHLPEILQRAEKYITKYGGHHQAAGFSTTESQIGPLRESLQQEFETYQPDIPSELNFIPEEFRDKIPPQIEHLKTRKEVIWLNDQNELSTDLLKETMSLDPFGQDFPMPEYLLPIQTYQSRLFGTQGQHLKINLPSGLVITSFNIDSNLQNKFFGSQQPQTIWVKVYVSQNTWNGRTNLELIGDVLEIKI
jgi:single-stranded-DNA-specific exonuclease